MAWWLLSGSALFWAGNFVVGRLVAGEAGPLTLSLWRWIIALVILLPFIVKPMYRQRQLIAEHWKLLTFLALFSVASFNTLLYVGLQTTTATNALIINSSIPVLIIAFGFLLQGQPAEPRSILGIGISLTGVLWLISGGSLSALLGPSFTEGDLWIFSSSIVWAIYSLYLRERPQALSPMAFLGFQVCVGIAAIAVARLINPFDEAPLEWTPRMTAAIGFFALFPSIGAYLCWNAGLAKVGAAKGGQIIHLMPVFGLVLAFFVLGERMTSMHVFGAALVATGLMVALLPTRLLKRALVCRPAGTTRASIQKVDSVRPRGHFITCGGYGLQGGTGYSSSLRAPGWAWHIWL